MPQLREPNGRPELRGSHSGAAELEPSLPTDCESHSKEGLFLDKMKTKGGIPTVVLAAASPLDYAGIVGGDEQS